MEENRAQQQLEQEQQAAPAVPVDPAVPGNIAVVQVPPPPGQDQQIVSDCDDGLEMHPHTGGYLPVPPFLPHQQQAMAMAQYYEARMRDHAAAYASAAAGAAWAAAQIAVSSQMPPSLPPPVVYPPNYHPGPIAPYLPPPYRHFHVPPAGQNSDFTPEERPIKRHQRMPLANNEQQERRGRRRQRVDYSSSSDGGRFKLKSQRQNPSHYNKKRREKLNLVGKTGVSALHEWCVHCKKMPPNFVLLPGSTDYFCFAAYVDDLEWSRGRGATKASAKQDAARKALQALVPGVVFDDSGLVMDTSANEAIEDLPNLAERLAIDATKKRRCDVYPGTSTTTEDDGEDENAYYANRGASVCSALLHAMWQINDDIPEPPSYSYDVPLSSNNSAKDGSRPSSFSCTATLNLRVNNTTTGSDIEDGETRQDEYELNVIPKGKRNGLLDNDSLELKAGSETNPKLVASAVKIKVLTSVGMGATKREARHIASAKLLCMIFPECEGMVEVKAAAEAAREQYAASKALKQQTKRLGSVAKELRNNGSLVLDSESRWSAESSDPNLPQSIIDMMCTLTGRVNEFKLVNSASPDEDEVSVESLSLSETKVPAKASPIISDWIPSINPSVVGGVSKSEARACSRQQQLEKMVDNALLTLNEFDEVGRSIPHQPNYDDVGRTVLRRAEAGDARFIYKLLLSGKRAVNDLSPMQATVSGGSSGLFWGPSSVTLLLCRAIASYDEPPLGCAVLTLGFAFNKGRVLRVAEIGSESHLPRERFLECLQQFAVNMKCELDTKPSTAREMQLSTTPLLNKVVDSYLKRKDFLCEESGTKLQSVKEEEPDIEDDAKEPGRPKQIESVKDKPSKRSRID